MARLLLISIDRVGSSMAGPGIRYWELARALSARHDVDLMVPRSTDLTSDAFGVIPYVYPFRGALPRAYDAVLCQEVTPPLVAAARRAGARVILDAYDPVLLENLAIHQADAPPERATVNNLLKVDIVYGVQHCDAMICAGEKQRDLWLGAAMALGRITPAAYDEDPALRSFIDVVPFGLSADDPVRGDVAGPRRRFGLADDDIVLLWGGGIWNWFDPLTPIRAMQLLARHHPAVKLVFMGGVHPNPNMVDMTMGRRAVALAEELRLKDTSVFFNDAWVPYQHRADWLLDATYGISTHFDSIESRFSFRTRMLDYIWAELPIIASEGDELAGSVREHGVGRLVRVGDAEQLAATVASLAASPEDVPAIRARLRAMKPSLRWGAISTVIDRLIAGAVPRPHGAGAPRYWLRRLEAVAAGRGVGATRRAVVSRLTRR